MKKKFFSHLASNNSPKMVDVSKKNKTKRIAIAEGVIKFDKNKFKKIIKFKNKKGNIINIAITAGIMATKKTYDLIPLCHQIPLDNINISIKDDLSTNSLIVTCNVKTTAKTGVEMESLIGATISCLTIYDMCKGIDRSAIIKSIRLIKKSGGKSGNYRV